MLDYHVSKLGFKATDKVTGFSGVVTTMSFDLYGCIQAVVTPESKDGEIKEGRWFDVNRLDFIDGDRVMDVPNFSSGYVAKGRKGASEKPCFDMF